MHMLDYMLTFTERIHRMCAVTFMPNIRSTYVQYTRLHRNQNAYRIYI